MSTVAIYVAKPPRPLGVSIIAILVMIGALLLVFTGAALLVGYHLNFTDDFAFFNNATAAGITLLIIGIISFIVAFGLFAQRIWAWAIILVLELISLVSALYTFFGYQYPNWSALVGVPIPAIIVIYLLLVKGSFVA